MKNDNDTRSIDGLLATSAYTSRPLHCKGCDNQCLVVKYTFANGKNYYSGNRCERVFTNGETQQDKGINVYALKNQLLFGADDADRKTQQPTEKRESKLVIGLPRCLNMFEDYPFWHTLFEACGIETLLSAPSRFDAYERSARRVMSDNICFPAKLAHSHVQDLIQRGADRVFMPFVVYERPDGDHNSYNCPVVSGYGEVIRSTQPDNIPIDTPAVSFKDRRQLLRQCIDYLKPLGIDDKTIKQAFRQAADAQEAFRQELKQINEQTLSHARAEKHLTVMLAGRPYHADPLIQHKAGDMLADMGIDVITDDIVRDADISIDGQAHFLPQWAYPNRILKAALWCARQDDDVQMVQLTSFGCGPDAFLLDETRDILARHGKTLTQLKLDDINNTGSMRLRVRSLVESLRLKKQSACRITQDSSLVTTPVFDEKCRHYKILVPFFTPFISPLIPAVMSLEDYDIECLPMSDAMSCELGLKYANNEVCYPATLVVGDLIKALRSGRYDTAHTAVAMTQTGGQCRASNYLALIKHALVGAGLGHVPVIAFAVGGNIKNEQPGFSINWTRLIAPAFRAIQYSDCIAKLYYATVCREKQPGTALALKDKYLKEADTLIRAGKSNRLTQLFADACREFDRACTDRKCPQVAIVGEIFLKFNPFAQRDVTGWLVRQGIEIVPPVLADFFLQELVNFKDNTRQHLRRSSPWDALVKGAYLLVSRHLRKVNKIGRSFRYFTPFHDIFDEAQQGKQVLTLSAQFGEGWLLPAEVMTCARQGIRNVVSLQPFGCIANHIVSKGIERSIKRHYPDVNILSLDFDSGVADVNVTNRMLLFIDKLQREEQ